MNPEKMTEALTSALSEAQHIAMTRKHQAVTVAHLFKYLIQPGELGREIFANAGVDIAAMDS
ncbi:Clp protease N-terminal domain-containing protein, partial [Levilactobacillus parabrevis]